jgi:3-oxoacyl-[acyl-carrier-protein] synthase II
MKLRIVDERPPVEAGDLPRIMVAGMGLVTAFGYGLEPFWEGVTNGRAAFSEITRFDPSRYRVRRAAQVRHQHQPYRALREAFLRHVVREATAGTELQPSATPPLLVVIATPSAPGEVVVGEAGPDLVDHLRDDAPVIADELSVPIVPVYVNQTCASGAGGVAYARTQLRAGRFDRALVVGAFVLDELDFAGMHALRVLTVASPLP